MHNYLILFIILALSLYIINFMEISLESLKNLLPSDIEKLKATLQQFEKSKERDIIKKFISDMKDIGSYDSIKDKKVSELLKTNSAVKVERSKISKSR